MTRAQSAHIPCSHAKECQLTSDSRVRRPIEMFLASLIGCKTSTAHYVARHLWASPNNIIDELHCNIAAERDPEGGRALPITAPPPVYAGLKRIHGVVSVAPRSNRIGADDVRQLGVLVDSRCPVAATLHGGACSVELEWRLMGAAHER